MSKTLKEHTKIQSKSGKKLKLHKRKKCRTMKTMWKTKRMSFRKDKNFTRIISRVSEVESVFKFITNQKSNELEIMTMLQTQFKMK